MKINRINYELYFVAYLDNNLSRGDMLELMAFLAQNPDLEEELNLVKDIKLEPETICFDAKNSLKKKNEEIEISKEKFDELCIGKIENTLNKQEKILLEKHIKLNPELEKEFKLFELTILQPDLSVEFTSKESLKRIELTTEQANQLCIGYIENNLNEAEEKQFNSLLNQSREFKKEYELYNLTVLKPDNSIIFANKKALKRSVLSPYIKGVFKISSVAAAAMILMLIILQIYNNNNKSNNTKIYANSKYIKKTNTIKNNKSDSYQIEKNKINNTFIASSKVINKNNITNNNNKFKNNDTIIKIANNNDIIKPDSSIINNNLNNIAIEPENNSLTNNKFDSERIKINKYLDTTLNAVFENSKYSHFRDMTNNVPYNSITASNSLFSNIGVWDVIKASTNGINYITGSQIEIENNTDKKKHLKHFSLKIGKIAFARTVHK